MFCTAEHEKSLERHELSHFINEYITILINSSSKNLAKLNFAFRIILSELLNFYFRRLSKAHPCDKHHLSQLL